MSGRPRNDRRSRRQRVANRLGLLVVLFMLFSSLASTIGGIAPVAAQGDTDPTPTPTAADDGGQNGDNQNQNQDNGQDQNGDNQSQDNNSDFQSQDVTGAIDIYKFACPSDFDPDNASLGDFDAMCGTSLRGIGFELYDTNGLADSTSTDDSGHAGFSDLAAAAYSIAEGVPEGYGAPWVYCASGMDPNSLGNYDSYPVTDGYYIDVDLSSAPYLVCYWYNIPTTTGSITIHKYICDSTSPLLTRGEPTLEDYQGYCTGSLQNHDIVFEITDDDGVASSQTVGDVIDDGVTWTEDEYAPGNVTIREYPAEGYGAAVVYCHLVTAGTDAPQAPMPVGLDSDLSFRTAIDSGQNFECYWFNLPDRGHTIVIVKYGCPDGYTVPEQDQSASIAQECTERLDGVDFNVSNGSDYDETGTTGDDGDGMVVFDDVNAGSYTISEQFPSGYSSAWVACFPYVLTLSESGGGQNDIASRQLTVPLTEATDGSFDVSYDNDAAPLLCVWYNIPGTDHDIIVYKYACPDGYDPTDKTADDLARDCTEPQDHVPFTLDNGNDYSESASTGEGFDSGMAAFDDVPEGHYTLSERIPEGYGTPYVWCEYVQTGTARELTQVKVPEVAEDGAFDFDYDPSRQLVCSWYNMPSEWTITIVKYFCRDGYTGDNYAFDAVYEACGNEEFSGFEFKIEGDNGYANSGESDDDGLVHFPLDSGDAATYTITENVPPDYGTPYWYCTYQAPENIGQFTDDLTPATDGAFQVSYDGQGHLYCYIYNFPTTTGGITIHKWTCPADMEIGTDTSASDFSDGCEQQDGVTYTLTDANSDEQSGTTGNDGTGAVSFDGFAYGNQSIVETVPAGYQLVYVRCFLTPANPEGEVPATEPEIADSGITIEVPEGYTLVCHFINQPTYGIDIYKWECPAGYDASSADLNQLTQDCTRKQSGVEFRSGSGMANYDSGMTGDDGAGHLVLDYEPGQVQITETIPDGYGHPLVWCTIDNGLQTLIAQTEQYEVNEAGTIDVTLEENWHLTCDWFNFPNKHTVIIYKFGCPPGYLPDQPTYQDVYQTCTDPQHGITFHLGSKVSVTGQSSVEDAAVFDSVEPGTLTISEQIPVGYGIPLVFCVQEPSQGMDSITPEQVTANEQGGIEYTLESGNNLICYWFNIPTDHDIVIHKYICPYGFDGENATIDELLQYCEVVTIPIPFSIDDGSNSETQNTGDVILGGVAFDGYATAEVTETIPEGYGDPRVFCRVEERTSDTGPILFTTAAEDLQEMDVADGTVNLEPETGAAADASYAWWCDWFNFQAQDTNNTVTIYKWKCPVFAEDMMIEDSQAWLLEHCTEAHDGVTFTLDDAAGPRDQDTGADGKVSWDDVNNGPVKITEDIPEGYGEPIVYCGWTATTMSQAGTPIIIDAFPMKYDSPGGVVTTSLDYPGTSFFCNWFNFPTQPGDITIYKWTCPEGYDLYAYGADPKKDCTRATNGVTYTVEGEGVSQETTTGDSIDGAVYWGSLEPGDYTITEDVPSGTDYVFVLHCDGARFPGIQPYPLSFGNELPVKLVSADHIVCDWYNVPRPNDGWITVYKYWCTTKTYKSDVDCQIYEDGVKFELWQHGGGKVKEGTTSEVGKLTFSGLPAGNYDLKEPAWKWCAIDIGKKGPDSSIAVNAGQETVVKVYNCDLPDKPKDPGTPVTPGQPTKPSPKQPTKYPNTGVNPVLALPSTGAGPIGTMSDSGLLIVGILAALALATVAAGLIVNRKAPAPPAPVRPGRPVSMRQRRAIAGAALMAVVAPVLVAAAQSENPPPEDGEGEAEGTPAGTPDVPQCRVDATPDASATPDDEEGCIRGEVPKHIAIEAIGVDADIEIQEIVAGELQDPTGPTLVTWYKETSRLGERGNGVYAGHLNYWGVPEGVFFAIKTLQPGDTIELTGENDEVFTYEVDWVKNQPGQEPPDPAVLGLTEEESITLITCGGEWDTTIAEYNQRTTVRAVRNKAEPV